MSNHKGRCREHACSYAARLVFETFANISSSSSRYSKLLRCVSATQEVWPVKVTSAMQVNDPQECAPHKAVCEGYHIVLNVLQSEGRDLGLGDEYSHKKVFRKAQICMQALKSKHHCSL